MNRILMALGLIGLLVLPAGGAELKPGAKLAFFGMHFIDTSTEGAYNGVREDETARVALIEAFIIEQFSDRGFKFLDISPVQEDVDRIVNPADCNYCDVLMARKLGADYSVTGEVQKVSNVILSMNIVIRDAPEGQFVKGMSVDIRGNNDDSWLRGVRYILKNNIFRSK
ncbi:MAG: DUF3280 domain-containing protein [Paracoccaceae bacterium]